MWPLSRFLRCFVLAVLGLSIAAAHGCTSDKQCQSDEDCAPGVCGGGFCIDDSLPNGAGVDAGTDVLRRDGFDSEDASDTGRSPTPPSPVVDLAVGGAHTCAALENGSVWCWGQAFLGQLGIGAQDSGAFYAHPVQVPNLPPIDELSEQATAASTCAISRAGALYCWGHNYSGQIGNGEGGGVDDIVAEPHHVEALEGVVDVATSDSHTVALREDGAVFWWGQRMDAGHNGELQRFPERVATIETGRAVSVGDYFSCVLIADETIKCWGVNDTGQLGDGTSQDRAAPVQVGELENVVDIRSGYDFSCALLGSGQVKCWGENGVFQLGGYAEEHCSGSRWCSPPVQVEDFEEQRVIEGVTSIALGSDFACVRYEVSKLVECWGGYDRGQLGPTEMQPDTSQGVIDPQSIPDLGEVSFLVAGNAHSCAVRASGETVCWGANTWGQLGDGTRGEPKRAVSVMW